MYLLMTNNHLDISNFDELKNIDSIRENYIKTKDLKKHLYMQLLV